MDGGAWWAAVHGVAKSRTRLSDFTCTFHFHALEKEMATHSSVLAWRIPGTGEPGGLPSMGSQSWTHWSDLAAAAEVKVIWQSLDQNVYPLCQKLEINKQSSWELESLCGHQVKNFKHSCCYCLVAQSRPTLCKPVDCSPPGFPVHRISQARTLE